MRCPRLGIGRAGPLLSLPVERPTGFRLSGAYDQLSGARLVAFRQRPSLLSVPRLHPASVGVLGSARVSRSVGKIARSDRSPIAWLLYACVLFNLMACGVAHGQMAGLMLSGLDGQFCLATGGDAAAGGGAGNQPAASDASSLTCPLCAGLTLSTVVLLLLAWLAGTRAAVAFPGSQRENDSPRYHWPPANPRASPMV